MPNADDNTELADKVSGAAKRRRNGARRGEFPKWSPEEGDPAERFARWVNELYDPEERDPFVGGERFGTSPDSAILLNRASGRKVRWDTQSQLMRTTTLQHPLSTQAGIKPRKLNPFQTSLTAWVVTQLATLRAGLDAAEEVALWWTRYVDSRPTITADRTDDERWRYVLAQWQNARAADERRSRDEERETFIVVDELDGDRFVRREDFAEHARSQVKGSLSWPHLNSRLAECGWQQSRFQRRQTAGGAPYVEARVYVVPANWPEPPPEDDDEA